MDLIVPIEGRHANKQIGTANLSSTKEIYKCMVDAHTHKKHVIAFGGKA